MGDPRKPKKKYSRPAHPWQAVRLEEEAKLIKDYALKNKKEIWKSASVIKNFKYKAKQLIASTKSQAKKEEKEVLDRLVKLKLLSKDSKIEDVLDIPVTTILERRLQTQVYKKGLARTPAQARQMVTHRHISVKGIAVNIPSYIVTAEDESFIQFSSKSPFHSEEHPERAIKKEETVDVVKEKSNKKTKEEETVSKENDTTKTI